MRGICTVYATTVISQSLFWLLWASLSMQTWKAFGMFFFFFFLIFHSSRRKMKPGIIPFFLSTTEGKHLWWWWILLDEQNNGIPLWSRAKVEAAVRSVVEDSANRITLDPLPDKYKVLFINGLCAQFKQSTSWETLLFDNTCLFFCMHLVDWEASTDVRCTQFVFEVSVQCQSLHMLLVMVY